jgi:hypothetical protein
MMSRYLFIFIRNEDLLNRMTLRAQRFRDAADLDRGGEIR